MNENEKRKVIENISNFYTLFQNELLDMLPSSYSGLSPLLSKAILQIYYNKFITPSILSKRLAITIPNTSRCLQQLEESGHVIRIKDENDKRVTHVQLSEKGLSLVENSLEHMDKLLLKKLSVLEEEEIISFSEAFSLLNGLLERMAELRAFPKNKKE